MVKAYYRVYSRVHDFFKDHYKAEEWMYTPNMALGGVSPLDMINKDQSKKLENWIISQIDEDAELTRIPGFVK